MADTAVAITAGSGTNIDTRTEATNGNHRQVIVVGDPDTNAGVAPVDATAGLKVNLGADNDVLVGGAAADDAAASGNPVQIGAKYFSAADTVDDADVGYLKMNQYRALCVQLTDDAGNLINPSSHNEDDAHTTADAGVQVLAVRRDAKAVGSGTDGDYSTINVNAAGDLRVDGGQSFIVRVEPTVTAGAYTANDTLGGEQTVAAAARVSGGGGVLTGITMIAQDDGANLWVADDVKVLIFQSNPAGTYTDNAALDSSSLTDADAQDLLLGAFSLDTVVTLGNIVMLKASNINMPYVCSGGSDLYAVAINVGGRTPDATDGITFLYHLIRD